MTKRTAMDTPVPPKTQIDLRELPQGFTTTERLFVGPRRLNERPHVILVSCWFKLIALTNLHSFDLLKRKPEDLVYTASRGNITLPVIMRAHPIGHSIPLLFKNIVDIFKQARCIQRGSPC
jgi:hypothetical protein